MQIHNVVRVTKNKKKALVGRGGKRGKTAGRGTKGQKARAGRKLRPEMRDIIKKLPKLRGYAFPKINVKPSVVNLQDIEKAFNAGEVVNQLSLEAKKLIPVRKGNPVSVKILGNGDITKAVTVSGLTVSAPAKTKIESAGGKVE